MSVAYAPLVQEDQRQQWLDYSYKNRGWITESARLKEVDTTHRDALHGTIQDHEHDRRRLQEEDLPSISQEIFHWENGNQVVEYSSRYGVYGPLWQVRYIIMHI